MKRKNIPIHLFWILISLLLIPNTYAQKKNFTYEQAFASRGGMFTNPLPRLTDWLDDNFYLESIRENGNQIVMKVSATSGESTVYLDYSEFDEKLPEGFSLSSSLTRTEDLNHFIFRKDDNLFYFNLSSGDFRKVSDSESEERNVTFSPNANKIAFTRDHDLFVSDLNTGKETRLTFDGDDKIYNGWASWVYYEEILGRGSRYRAFWWSPDSKMLAYLRFDDNPVPEFTIVTGEGIHGRVEVTPYPKPGDPNPFVKLGIAHLENGETVWIDTNEDLDRYVANPETGEKRKIYTEKQKGWVEFFEDLYFFEDGSGFLLRSDVDGWRNLYYYDMQGTLISKVTDLDWRVTGISRIIEKTKTLFFSGTGGMSTENHLFSIKLNGKNFRN